MGCLGVHFALTEADVAAIRAIDDEVERVSYVSNEIEERECGGEWACETDKAWDAIHRSLTDGRLEWSNGKAPLNLVVLGGELLYHQTDYIMSLKTPSQVVEIARALPTIDKSCLRAGYDRIRAADYGEVPSSRDFEYTWEWFLGLVEFYARAAAAGRFVLFTADQ